MYDSMVLNTISLTFWKPTWPQHVIYMTFLMQAWLQHTNLGLLKSDMMSVWLIRIVQLSVSNIQYEHNTHFEVSVLHSLSTYGRTIYRIIGFSQMGHKIWQTPSLWVDTKGYTCHVGVRWTGNFSLGCPAYHRY